MIQRRAFALFISVLFMLALGLGSGPSCGETEEIGGPDLLPLAANWEEYADPLKSAEYQEDCRPVRYPADPAVEFKGSIILIHGFTACPQQYFDVVEEILVPAGYDVYLPLLPGHGRIWEENTSSIDEVPDADNWQSVYGAFIDQIALIAEKLDGPVNIGGLSLGGALALWTVEKYPDLFDKVVLFAPFLALSKTKGIGQILLNGFVDVTGQIPVGKDAIQSWGDGCYAEWEELGRAGNCHFTAGQLVGHNQLGKMLSEAEWHTETIFHFVTAENDPAVDNGAIEKLIDRLKENEVKVYHIEYPAPTNHSMLSPYDGAPDEDKFWLPHLKANIRRLFVNDLPMVGFTFEP